MTGTSDEIASVADDLKDMEKTFSKRYEKATGTDSNIITGFMETLLCNDHASQVPYAPVY